MKSVWRLIVEVLSLIVGGFVFVIFFVIGVLYSFLKHLIKFDYSLNKQLVPILRSFLLSLDGMACAGGGELLNDALKIKGKIRYGKWYQTISAITGLINIYEKDTWLRRFLDKTLGKNHCAEAISVEDQFYYKNN